MSTDTPVEQKGSSGTRRLPIRIFLQFVLSALIPIALMAGALHFFVGGFVDEQSADRLHADSKQYGLALLGRLRLIEERSRDVSAWAQTATDLGGQAPALPDEISGILVLDDGTVQQCMGESADVIPEIVPPTRDGRSRVLIQRIPGETPSVYMVVTTDPGDRTLLVDVDENRLWGDPANLPYQTGMCVYGPSGRRVHCSDASLMVRMGAAKPKSGTNYAIGPYREDYQFGAWDLFLESAFDGGTWTIVAVTPSDVVGAADTLLRQLPYVALFSILAVALLAIGRIRRTLRPLEVLSKGTRDLHRGKLDHRIELDSGDEFQELASSFNDMADGLEQQVGLLTLYADIDRAVVSRAQADTVVQIILGQEQVRLPGNALAIAIFDADAHGQNRLWVRSPSEPRSLDAVPLTADGGDLHRLRCPVNLTGSDSKLAALFPESPVRAAQVAPAILGDTCHGLIAVGWSRGTDIPAEPNRTLVDLAHRLAVAVDAARHHTQLYWQANYDATSGLPNRHLLMERLHQVLGHGRPADVRVALILMNIKNFKQVNDVFGHATGDRVLTEAGRRLQGAVRDGDTVARIGGDEFAILMPDMPATHHAELLARKALTAMQSDLVVEGQSYHLRLNTGLGVAPSDGNTAEELFLNTSIALNTAKASTHSALVFFTEDMNIDAVGRARLENDLKSAVASNQLMLHYQPQYSVDGERIVGAEALVRWLHPERGMIPPGEFIPLSERSEMIHVIGAWVLQEASRQWRSWQREGFTGQRIAINVSPQQLRDPGFLESIERELDRAPGIGDWLEIEVTEHSLAYDLEAAGEVLAKIRDLGVKIAIDDFGTGYSSLSYLRDFPVDILKVDRSFLADIPSNPKATNLLMSIVAMAASLDKEVIIEGVETREQLTFLQRNPELTVQGYLTGAPAPADRMLELLRQPDRWPQLANG